MYKKILTVTLTVTLALSLIGCGNLTKKPQTSPQVPDTAAQLPPGHPSIDLPSSEGDLSTVHPTDGAQPVDPKVQAEVENKINDLLNKKYPGEWKVSGTTLSKGTYTENSNYKIVDDIKALFPGTMGVSIFVGEERISSSVMQGTERVLKGYATPATVGDVMKNGKTISTSSSGFTKVYMPLASSGKTLGVLTVSVPE